MKIINTLLISLFICLNSGLAQPRDVWVRRYTEAAGGRAGWEFHDVYLTSESNYAMCGRMSFEGNPGSGIWLLITDNEGGVILNRSYRWEENDAHALGYTIIETDDRGFVFGGVADREGRPRFSLTKIDSEGEIEWWNHYGTSSGLCYAVIELKGGGYAACGTDREGNGANMAYVIRLNGQGDLIWEQRFGQAANFTALKETEGGLVLIGNNSFAVKINFEGEPIWTFGPSETGSFNDLTSCDNGFAICGSQSRRIDNVVDVDHRLLKITGDGEVLWDHSFDLGRNETSHDITRTTDRGFLITGQSVRPDGGQFFPSIVRTDGNGNMMWTRTDSLLGDMWPQLYKSSIINVDGSYVVVGSCRPARGGSLGGMVAKIVPERSAPAIIDWSPVDLDLEVLVGDQIEFWVQAVDLQEDSIRYEWLFDGEALEFIDSTATIIFDSEGVYTVGCVITDGDLSDSLNWTVRALDFFISSYYPEMLNLNLRRGETIDFSIDTVRAVEGLGDVQYQWIKHRTDDPGIPPEIAGTESRATISFLQSGHYAVEGLAYRGEASDAVTWNVSVRGVVWSFAPEDLALEVLPDSLIRFEVIPSNPEDSSLSARWFVDDEFAAEDTTILDWGFFYPVHSVHNIYCVLSDSIESDTVSWTVTVRDLSVKDKRDAYPTRSVLLSVSPNPFNSTLTIRYSSPINREATSISIHDISGREVFSAVTAPSVTEDKGKAVKHGGMTAERADGYGGRSIHPAAEGGATKRLTAERTLTLDASIIPAGVYFVRLQSGGEVMTKKVVLIR